MQHQFLILLLGERSHEQASVLFWDRTDRCAPPAFFFRYLEDISKTKFSHLTLIFSPVFEIGNSKSAYSKETEFWFYWQCSLTQFTCCCCLCYCIHSCFSIKHPNSQPPKDTPLQLHLLSWLNKLQLQKVFFSRDFLNQISVFFLLVLAWFVTSPVIVQTKGHLSLCTNRNLAKKLRFQPSATHAAARTITHPGISSGLHKTAGNRVSADHSKFQCQQKIMNRANPHHFLGE